MCAGTGAVRAAGGSKLPPESWLPAVVPNVKNSPGWCCWKKMSNRNQGFKIILSQLANEIAAQDPAAAFLVGMNHTGQDGARGSAVRLLQLQVEQAAQLDRLTNQKTVAACRYMQDLSLTDGCFFVTDHLIGCLDLAGKALPRSPVARG